MNRFAVFLFAIPLSASVFAAPVVSGAPISAGDGGDCVLLAHSVTINLSRGVKASYVCATTPDVIGLAVCHVAGRRNAELLDGSVTSTGIVYTVRSDGGALGELAGCPAGEEPIPDDMVPVGIQ